MDILKQQMEKRGTILEELETLKTEIESEKRNADEKTLELIKNKNEELRDLDLVIEELKKSAVEETVEIKEGEKREMEKGNKELRGLAEFIRDREVREESGIAVTKDGAATIPELVENNIVEKLNLYSEVFAEARHLPSQAGSLKIPRETEISKAGFVGELEDVGAIDLALESAELNQKRVGAYTGLTNQLVNDTAVDIIGYAEDNLSRAAALAIEESILAGKGDAEKQFKGIVEDKDVAVVEATEINLDTLIDIHNELHPTFLPEAKFYMRKEVYDAISKLKDGNAHPYIQNGVVNGKLTKTLFEFPIVVTNQLPEGKPVVFGAVSRGYTVMIKKDMFLRHITGDTRNALRGTQMLVLDAYMDGVVHDPQAFVVLKSGE